MRRIELKTLADERFPENQPIEYAQILRDVVRQPLDRQKGIQIEEMRQSIRLLDAIDSANGTLEVEDADYALLKQKLDAMNWTVADKRILQLIDDVSNA